MSQGIKETFEVMVIEFMMNMENVDPFEQSLMNFSMKLKSKLLEIANLSIYDRKAVETSTMLAIEGIEDSIDKFLNDIDSKNTVLLERTEKFLREINNIIREINELGYISNREPICRVTSKFEDHILTINGKLKYSERSLKSILSRLFR